MSAKAVEKRLAEMDRSRAVSTAPEAPPPPATRFDLAAWILTAAALLLTFHFHLVPALVAGLLVHTILHRTARFLHGPRLSHGAAKVLALALVGTLASAATVGAVLLIVAFLRGHAGALPALFQKMSEALDQTGTQLRAMGVNAPWPESFTTAEELRAAFTEWLKEHSAELGRTGGEFGRLLFHAVMGLLVALFVFFREGPPSKRPLAAALGERVRRFATAFETVILAQFEISALNTLLTAVYLLVLLPMLGRKLPLSGTLVAVTFLAGLIPVVGNLISNIVIVVLSLGVSPWTAVGSLTFLIVIHKLEYFVNAKIVGGRIHAAAWEILLAIIGFEVAFGVPGVVLAPVIYAYAKKELSDRALV